MGQARKLQLWILVTGARAVVASVHVDVAESFNVDPSKSSSTHDRFNRGENMRTSDSGCTTTFSQPKSPEETILTARGF